MLPLPAPPGQSSSTDKTTESLASIEPLPASNLCCQYFACSKLLQQIMTTLKPSSLFIVATFETLILDAIVEKVFIVADAAVAIVEWELPTYVDVESLKIFS